MKHLEQKIPRKSAEVSKPTTNTEEMTLVSDVTVKTGALEDGDGSPIVPEKTMPTHYKYLRILQARGYRAQDVSR